MIFLCIPLVVLFFMLGGQINKLFRPIGVSLSIISIYLIWHNHSPYYCIPTLAYAVILSLGYGENSKLMKWIDNEQLIRIFLGLMNCLPITIISLFTNNWMSLIFIPIIVAVECIRMGSWGKIGKYDILPVDIFRGLALSIAISFALI